MNTDIKRVQQISKRYEQHHLCEWKDNMICTFIQKQEQQSFRKKDKNYGRKNKIQLNKDHIGKYEILE